LSGQEACGSEGGMALAKMYEMDASWSGSFCIYRQCNHPDCRLSTIRTKKFEYFSIGNKPEFSGGNC
jgi:hypothetical protein